MLSALAGAIRFVMVAIMSVATFLTPFLGKKEGKIERKSEDCKAAFAAISDTHLTDSFIRLGMFEFGLQDMAEATDRLDALVINGDITDHGYPEHWQAFTDTLLKYDISDNNIMVLGNHDTWGGDRTGDYTKENFIKYSKQATGRELENVYFTAEINGYPAIVLGSQADHTGPTFYQDQLDWFAEEMEKASEKGLPMFVFCHQPFNGTHGLPLNWEMEKDADPTDGGIGEFSDYILNICNQYKNVIFVSGHVHAGLSSAEDGTNYASVEKLGNVTSVNLPSYEYFDVLRHGHMVNGTGFVFEIYESESLLRARNFATGTWLEKYNFTIELEK